MIEELDEQYLSDLKAEDIPDECVSEVDMDQLENEGDLATQGAKSNLLTAQADIDAAAEEANRKFITEFVKMYAESPDAAKRKYYLEKPGFDIETEHGQE